MLELSVQAWCTIAALALGVLVLILARKQRKRGAQGSGKLLWDAAEAAKALEVQQLCSEFCGDDDVLNWENPLFDMCTPLMVAVAWDKVECARILANTRGVDCNRATKGVGWTALFLAAFNAHHECVKVLLTVKGIELNKSPVSGICKGKSPLAIARENPSGKDAAVCAQIVQLLQAAGAE